MPNSELTQILKTVSRSFYLSIRVLPLAMREPISIAYLLARAADAIADTAAIPNKERLIHLLNFRNLVSGDNSANIESLLSLIPKIEHTGERELIMQLPAVFIAFSKLPTTDFSAVKKVVSTLTIGMEKDLTFFSDSTRNNNIKALPDDNALDEYTYYVAGCVGEFWTDLSIQHTPSLSHWKKEEMLQIGIQFGKALQLTNILRDIAKDAKLNRCYLPSTNLEQYGLNTDLLLNKSNNTKFEPIISKWLKQADSHFNSAEIYLLSIPRTCLRLRLAALWPILIGLSTLKLIKQKQNFLDSDINIKVNRKWVYKMLLISIPASFSNAVLRYWIKKARN